VDLEPERDIRSASIHARLYRDRDRLVHLEVVTSAVDGVITHRNILQDYTDPPIQGDHVDRLMSVLKWEIMQQLQGIFDPF
jgi:hypothetical protein